MTASGTLSDLLRTIRTQPGVEAAVLLGQDGLAIQGEAGDGFDTEELAARARTFLDAADGLIPLDTTGASSGAFRLVTAVLEYPGHYGVVSVLSPESALLIVASSAAQEQLGLLIQQVRSHRDAIAALV